jgi:hypothetical protein
MEILVYSDPKFEALLRLFFIQLLIPDDGHFEPALSLALDMALVDLEAMWQT